MGGSERVVLTLAKAFGAPVYTSNYLQEKTFNGYKKLKIIEVHRTKEHRWGVMNAVNNVISTIRFSKIKELKMYDCVITSGVLAVFASKLNKNNIWYCHTPNRTLYDLYEQIRNQYSWIGWKPALISAVKFWRHFDQKAVMHVNKLVANSMNVRKRIRKFYGREAIVINPPVSIEKFYHRSAEDYWLSTQRIVPEKRIDMQVKIFKRLPHEKLIIAGEATPGHDWYKRKLQEMIGKMKNIEWKGAVRDEEMTELYANCKGVIQTSIDEDFGLVPVEAMAAGKPCLAVNEGGFSETIIHGKTGLLINKPYVGSFIKAIKNFAPEDFSPKLCRKRAEDFSEDSFVQKIRNLVKPFGV